MIAIVPGVDFWWRDNDIRRPNGAAALYAEVTAWIEENIPDGACHETGGTVIDVTYTFDREDDAIAFKLKFGL